ncbi:MAG: CPBP family intramembrane metalloprotease [Anaerolineae bacterium]|jgi:membrane protease YdiL (CAAX protease family)
MVDRRSPHLARRNAHVALAALLPAGIIGSLLFILRRRISYLQGFPAVPVGTALTHWLMPILIVLFVEKPRDGETWAALGLTVKRERVGAFAILALFCLVLPACIVGVDRGLLLEFFEQVVYIGVAEEVFFRGYLTERLCQWLGNLRGLLLGGIIFGLAHIVSRVSQHGLAYPRQDALLGLQTSLGGLLFGFIYLRSRSIVPGAILHLATNAYIGRFAEMLGR